MQGVYQPGRQPQQLLACEVLHPLFVNRDQRLAQRLLSGLIEEHLFFDGTRVNYSLSVLAQTADLIILQGTCFVCSNAGKPFLLWRTRGARGLIKKGPGHKDRPRRNSTFARRQLLDRTGHPPAAAFCIAICRAASSFLEAANSAKL
jgi:hypothetical protein